MALDLIFGKTKRNWSCGAYGAFAMPDQPATPSPTQLSSSDLASLTRSEIDKNTRETIRLTNEKRLPELERKAFGAFFRKWLNFFDTRKGTFKGPDYVALWNFRDANKRFTERLATFAVLAKTPLHQPVDLVKSAEVALTRPPGYDPFSTPRPWGWLLGLGLGLAGLGFITGKRP